MTEPRRYRAYLLRLWQADGADGLPTWRAALEDARTGERHGFADLSRLCAFLKEQTAAWTEDILPASGHEAEDRPMED